MKNKFYQTYLGEGQVSVSRYLLKEYRALDLTSDEFLLLIRLMDMVQSIDFRLQMEAFQQQLQMDDNAVFQFIQVLLEKGCLAVAQVENEDGRKEDIYSFEPMFQQLELHYKRQQQSNSDMTNRQLLMKMESEFRRSLSAMEIQTIIDWMEKEQYSIDLIDAALKEAVLSQVYSLKYMDRILLEWTRKGYRSSRDVQQAQKNHQRKLILSNKKANQSKDNREDVPLIDWMKLS